MKATHKNRKETRKHQSEAVQHFHPRKLARGIVHKMAERSDVFGVNQKHPGTTQSPFARNWRNEAERFAAHN